MEKEIWKDIWVHKWIDFTWLYKVSNLGRIKSIRRKLKNNHFVNTKILKLRKNINWYFIVNLYKDWIMKTLTVHRLVASSFLNNKLNKRTVNHINWIRYDNRLINLEWATYSENLKHRSTNLWYIPHNKWKNWKLSHHSKKVNQYDLNWNLIKTWDWTRDIERILWFNHSWISANCRWAQKTSYWFKWKYFNK